MDGGDIRGAVHTNMRHDSAVKHVTGRAIYIAISRAPDADARVSVASRAPIVAAVVAIARTRSSRASTMD